MILENQYHLDLIVKNIKYDGVKVKTGQKYNFTLLHGF